MLKKITSIFILLSMMLSFSVSAEAIHEFKNTNKIAGGVTHTAIKRLDSSGWQNINIIEADLTHPFIKTEVLSSSSGLNTLETVEKLAAENNAIAAINGDFFAWSSSESGKGSAVGVIMNNSELLSSSSETDGMYTFAIDNLNRIICENVKTNITLTAPNGKVLTIKHLNKFDSLAEPVIYTSDFSEITGGSYNNILEVVIADGIVTEMRRNLDGVKVPENGYVIRHLPEYNPFLIDNLKAGDKVEIKIDANFDLSTFKTMTGGGTMLVTQGQLAKITHNVAGTNPRTVIACDKSRTKLYLITVDGRQTNAKGYTLSQLANYLIEIGMYDAMNLDGGGSTTMVAKQEGKQTLVNLPSEGSQRKVATGIGIVSDAPQGSYMAQFEIEVSDHKVYSGTTRTFEIKNPLDEYGNHFEGTIPEISWSIDDGYGYFEGNVLHAQGSGEDIKVYANCNGFTAEKEIGILNGISSLSVSPSHFSISDFENPEVNVIAMNDKGISATVESRDIRFSDKNNRVKTVSVLDKSAEITFSDILLDMKNGEFTSESYPNEAVAKAEADYSNFKSGNSSAKLSYDFSGVADDKSGAAYLKFTSPVSVSEGDRLGVWVYSPVPIFQWLRAEFKDENGNVLRQTLTDNIDFSGWKYLTFDVPEKAVALTRIYVVQNDFKEKSEGYLLFDALSNADSEFEGQTISLTKSQPQNGSISFSVVGDMPKSNTLLSKLLAAKTASNLKNSGNDYVFSLANYDFAGIDEIMPSGYSSFKKDNSLFITLNNSGGYTSTAQWEKFANDTKDSFNNLFIFLNESYRLTTNENELKMFAEKLEALSKQANVYVFYPDFNTNLYHKWGACFVSVGNLTYQSPKSAAKMANNFLIPKVTISNNTPIVSFVNMY